MKKRTPYEKYKKYCKWGQHYVSHLVDRYSISAKFDTNRQPILVPRINRICKQCAEQYGQFQTMKQVRLEILTRTLMR